MKVCAIVCLGCLALVAGAEAWGETTLTLKEEAFVSGAKVRLGDVADIHGMDAVALGKIELSTAARPGATKQLNASLVNARLRNAGFDPDEVTVKGAAQIRATTLSQEVSGIEIAESLQQFVENEMPWDQANTEVTVPPVTDDLLLPDGVVEFEWRASPQYRYIGDGTFRGTVFVDGERQKVLLCKANVETYREIVAAARDIPRGHVIGSGDIEVRIEAASTRVDGVPLSLKEAVGLLARRTIFPGNTITSRNTARPKIIKRNQIVSVLMASGGLHVQTQARALTDASAGDLLRCENLNSEEEFQVRVRKDGVVVLE